MENPAAIEAKATVRRRSVGLPRLAYPEKANLAIKIEMPKPKRFITVSKGRFKQLKLSLLIINLKVLIRLINLFSLAYSFFIIAQYIAVSRIFVRNILYVFTIGHTKGTICAFYIRKIV